MGFFSVGHVLFFCLFPYSSQVLGAIFTELPVISSRDSFIKGQGHRGQRSNKVKVIKAKGQIYVVFFLFVPLLLPGPWADLHQTWWEG